MKKSNIIHGWNRETQKTLCGINVNLLTMQKALHPESDKKDITCNKCKKNLQKK
jgi:hypothetical protein